MYKRFISSRLQDALTFSPAVYLSGPRQSGKSTMAELLLGQEREYLSLDNINLLQSAKIDPIAFIEARTTPCVIDEIQRAPELMLPIKHAIDQNRLVGRFLLTGSANILNMPQVADSLAGRMIIMNLFPLSVQEIVGHRNSWIEQLFDDKISDIFAANKKAVLYQELCRLIIWGGYPVISQGLNTNQRHMWFQSYVQTMIERDLREIANFQDVMRMHRLFQDIVLRSASVVNTLDLARDCRIPAASITTYLLALESIFLIKRIPAWFTNKHKRLAKAPKLFMNDSGLLCDRLFITEDMDYASRSEWGYIVETFIYNELQKQISWSGKTMSLYHYRTYQGEEVDFVVENHQMEVVGVEVKASKSISQNFAKGLLHLREDAGDKFKGGMILYMGADFLSLGNDIFAVPMSYIL